MNVVISMQRMWRESQAIGYVAQTETVPPYVRSRAFQIPPVWVTMKVPLLFSSYEIPVVPFCV